MLRGRQVRDGGTCGSSAEREEAEEEDWWRQDPGEDDRNYGGRDGEEGGGRFFAWLEHAIAVRFAPYPYAPELPYAFTSTARTET